MTAPRKLDCIYCGNLVLVDDERLTVSHIEPQCEQFAEACKRAGSTESRLEIIDADTGYRVPRGEA